MENRKEDKDIVYIVRSYHIHVTGIIGKEKE